MWRFTFLKTMSKFVHKFESFYWIFSWVMCFEVWLLSHCGCIILLEFLSQNVLQCNKLTYTIFSLGDWIYTKQFSSGPNSLKLQLYNIAFVNSERWLAKSRACWYLTIIRRRRGDYRRIFAETKSRWIFPDNHRAWGE